MSAESSEESSRTLIWDELATGLRFPEGPVALGDGSVIVVEIARGALTRVGPE